MLPYFSKILKTCFSIIACIALLVFGFANTGYTQSLGDPIVHITFGSGFTQFAGALKPDSGSTTYIYTAASPQDNYYTIANSTRGLNGGWGLTTDHTGDPNGYMMIVNASYTPGLFYTRKIPGLCGSTTYQFSAFIKNIIKNPGAILPNVTFSIESTDGTLLGSGNTNDISALGVWINYPFTFTTPANTEDVVIKMVNNAPGGGGNDIAIDDIVFRPYGQLLQAAFSSANITFCEGAPQPITIKTTTQLPPDYYQKLQMLQNGVWVDQSPAGTASSFTFQSPTAWGAYSYRVVAGYSGTVNISSCVVASNYLDIRVLPLPVAKFSVTPTTCQEDLIVFKDQSTSLGSTIATWLWDFGDGQTSTDKDPSHLYANPGDYTVKLTVTNSNGCAPTFTTQSVHVIRKVNMAFNYSTPDCVTKAIIITDASVSTEGVITSRVWDFGDGSPTETKSDNAPFQHTYTVAGSYALKFVITTDKSCATLIKTIVISPFPVANFILPAVCRSDSYAKFTDSTTIADGSTSFTYLWNFGDADANPGNPNTSPQQNPTHRFIKAQLYQVTLTVTSINGCQTTITKPLMVNGSIPDAKFHPLNGGALCSDREVFFVNTSDVDVGTITKIKWYFDTSDTTIQLTDNNPYKGKLYRYLYPQFSSPATRNYQVRMLAYSGGTCVDPEDQTITLFATPVLVFNAPDSVCLNNGPIQFTGQEGSGITGTGKYIGKGVSASGLFDAAIAGIGADTIRYIYTTATACADTIKRVIIVKPIATVDAGPDVAILSGASTRLHAVATGEKITYQWSPTTGLNSSTIPDPVVTLTDDITYTLTVTNSLGCAVTDNVTVRTLQVPVIPNAFTPNHDGVNDKWDIKYLDTYPGCTVDVFNRSGQKVYSSIGYKVAWDGQVNNSDLPFGVYYYIIDPKNGRKPTSGYVTIIR